MAKQKMGVVRLPKGYYLLIGLLILTSALFAYRLGTITPGISSSEQATARTIISAD
jgi:precorrin-6B methylase 1